MTKKRLNIIISTLILAILCTVAATVITITVRNSRNDTDQNVTIVTTPEQDDFERYDPKRQK